MFFPPDSGVRFIDNPPPPPPGLLRPDGIIELRPAADFDAIESDAMRLWCHLHARYTIVTSELIDWLREKIDGRRAIEIGSGAGDIAFHLGIPGTDNKCQTFPDVAAYYAASGQPTIRYPAWVEQIDAIDAIEKHDPQVVIGSWLTHWVSPDKPLPPGATGNMYGIKERKLLATGVTYILIGNLKVHQQKPILKIRHEEHKLRFLRSRANKGDLDRVFIWRGTR